jgi:hypothetical protein
MIIKLPSWPWTSRIAWEKLVLMVAVVLAIAGTIFALKTDTIIAYGDAESHLNIAKRVVHSLTPGMAQLGGIWLPLPHMMMVPLVYFDTLWRTGLAGSIVSGLAYVLAGLYVYRLSLLLTKHHLASFFGFLVFATNPNVIYMQATPMTELPLIAFFVISSYYFIKYLVDRENVGALVAAGFFGFCATLTRYDGWFLVAVEGVIIILIHLKKSLFPVSERGEGHFFLYATLAFVGIIGWLGWGWLILGNPLYFTASQFSAKSQQLGWLARGQLPGYHNLWLSFVYYAVTSMSNIGILLTGVFGVGLATYLWGNREKDRFLVAWLLLVPFIFYVVTMFIGQSMIFIPHITPVTFDWRLFNVRYGLMMVPVAAIFVAYLFAKVKWQNRVLLVTLFLLQFGLYLIGYSKVTTFEDGTVGLSSGRRPDAERWLAQNYDSGLVLMDDYSRIISVIRSKIPMQNMIYIGTKPYWERSMVAPQDYARWVIVQKGDSVWKQFYATQEKQDFLYTYYRKVYTSDEILVFQRNFD